ncbi:MAG: urease accessory protein UreE [Proteobacteria bacterium]|nr:MAG: urease accessory protein UreE [Pseudomonadota bacterium]
MITLTLVRGQHAGPVGAPESTIALDYDQRTRSRLRARLDDGREAALDVARGGVLREGDLLYSGEGLVICVRAALELVSAVYCDDPLAMARLCYHLGNRHVALEIGAGRVAYQADHVLDELVRGLSLEPVRENAPFQPEGGAYGHHHGQGGHGHGH